MRLELPVKCPRFCSSVHRGRYFSHFSDEWQYFLSTFSYKLKNALNEQPQFGISSERLYHQWRCISQKSMFTIRNSRPLYQLWMEFKWIGNFYLIIFTHLYQPSFFNQNMAKIKMGDKYYLETILKGTDCAVLTFDCAWFSWYRESK